jgi:hypothetical protein
MAPENDSNSPTSSPKIPSYNPSDRIPGNGPITASGLFKSVDGKTIEIRDVWASNLEEEMGNIREILEKYPYVAMVRMSPSRDVFVIICINLLFGYWSRIPNFQELLPVLWLTTVRPT